MNTLKPPAKVIESNINFDEEISKKEDIFLLIDDKFNFSLLDEKLFDKFVLWKNGLEDFGIQEIKNLQYLELEVDKESVFICLCTGIEESYCFARVWPISQVDPVIETKIEYIHDYYDQDMKMTFFNH